MSPDGKFAYSGGYDTFIRAWDCTAEVAEFDPHNPGLGLKEVFKLAGHAETVTRVAVTPDGKSLVSIDWVGRGLIWSIAGRKSVAEFQVPLYLGMPPGLAMSRDGKTFATADFVSVIVWDAATGKEAWRVPIAVKFPSSVAYSPDGRYLAVSGKDAFEQWDIAAKALRPVGE